LQAKAKEGVSKGHPFYLLGLYIHFFCSSKRNEPKKRRPEKTTVPVFRQLHMAISRSKKQDTVRTFSGSPSRILKTQIVDN